MISGGDIGVVLFLAFLEGVLSIDNALVLAMLAKHLPPVLQKRALSYGLIGAVVFRLIALFFITHLIRYTWIKLLGGGYLIFIAVNHMIEKWKSKKGHGSQSSAQSKARGFWMTVFVIELTDIAFAVDSIMAAVALSKKFWVIFAGGMIGVILMRFAASVMIQLLNRFPALEESAYSLVFLIGLKVILETLLHGVLDFHSWRSPEFWIFWALMAFFMATGFRKRPAPGAVLTSQKVSKE